MSVTDNKQRMTDFFDAGNRGDIDACAAMISDDVVWTNVGSAGLCGVYRGKASLMQDLLGPLFGQLKQGIRSEIVRLTGEGDIVVAETRGTAETLAGQPYNNQYCQVVRFRDGLIVEVTEYCDTALVARTFDDASSE